MAETTKDQINILLIEDDEHHAFLEEDALRSELACELRIVHSKLELTSEDIRFAHIILLDFNLPDATGEEILEEIRRFTDVPVIIITGNDELQIAIDTLKSGANDFLVKSPKNIGILPLIVRQNLHKYDDEQKLKKEIIENEALHTKIKTLQQVLTTLAHYINNSTTTIFGYAQLCAQETKLSERCNKLAKVSLLETQKIGFVLQELENFINTMQIKTTNYVDIPEAMFAIEENIKAKMKKLKEK